MTRLAEVIDLYNEHALEPGEPLMGVQRLSELSGIPDRTVYRHYKGETAMSLEQAAAYAEALKTTVAALAEAAR